MWSVLYINIYYNITTMPYRNMCKYFKRCIRSLVSTEMTHVGGKSRFTLQNQRRIAAGAFIYI